MTSRATLTNNSMIRAAKRLLLDPRMALPTGLGLTTFLSISNRRLCRVRYRDGFWEYRWREGTMLHEYPALSASAENPTGSYDFPNLFFWDYEPKRNDIVLDVGAGIGGEVFSLRIRVGPGGQVFAFEAHPTTFGKLSRLCELNSWSNVEAIQAAVIDKSGRVSISDEDQHETNSIFSRGKYEVDGIALDDFIMQRGITHIDYLKMNIEEAERLAIRRMETVARTTDHVCISCHDFLGTEWGRTSEEVRAWLASKSFRVLDRRDDPRSYAQFYLYGSKS